MNLSPKIAVELWICRTGPDATVRLSIGGTLMLFKVMRGAPYQIENLKVLYL